MAQHDTWLDDDADYPQPTPQRVFPIYKEMGGVRLGDNGDGPIVAMARVIQDDAESGGSYIMRLGEMTITIAVEVPES